MSTRKNRMRKLRKVKKSEKNYKRIIRGGEEPNFESLRLEPRNAITYPDKDMRWVMTNEKIKRDEAAQREMQDKKTEFMRNIKSPFGKGGKTKKKNRKYRK
jgi:hypothetical protein